jgi:hypothetical protein
MLFQTIYGYVLTGDRRYLDWTMNMYDKEFTAIRKNPSGGRLLSGKALDNPARALAFIIPNHMVEIDFNPPRIGLTPPGTTQWKIFIRNATEKPLDGTLSIGPLPAGVKMETQRKFHLDVEKEVAMEFPVEISDEIATGRAAIPFKITTHDENGRTAERNAFFAIHALRPATDTQARLLFDAPLDGSARAAVGAGGTRPTAGGKAARFVAGKTGQALAPDSPQVQYASVGNVLPEAGTLAAWMQYNGAKANQRVFEIEGYGHNVAAVATGNVFWFGGQKYALEPDKGQQRHWHHYAITWDLKQVAFYIDGREVKRFDRNTFEIPVGPICLNPMGLVAIDDVQVYSQPLSAEQLAKLAGK